MHSAEDGLLFPHGNRPCRAGTRGAFGEGGIHSAGVAPRFPQGAKKPQGVALGFAAGQDIRL